MPVKPEVAEFLQGLKKLNLKPLTDLSPEEARAQMEAGVRARAIPEIPVGSVENKTIPGPDVDIPIRVYRPESGTNDAHGALVYFHGGGHVIGSLDTHDSVARALCRDSKVIVLSVDYRKAPENKFPAAVNDAYAACEWIYANATDMQISREHIAVGGDSAGGNLALVAALMARNNNHPPLAFQLLVYPVIDYAGGTNSYTTFSEGYGMLEAKSMEWFRSLYLRDENDMTDWRASPGRSENFADLPPTLLITAECDVLNNEGVTAAQRLRDDGVTVEHVNYMGMIHGFFSMAPIFEDASLAQTLAANRLKDALTK